MEVSRLTVRDFRCYEAAELNLGPGITVVHGPNGAGKTNLLEALYFGCTGRSCRTSNEREMVRLGTRTTRVTVDGSDADGPHSLAVGFEPGEPKRMLADGAPVERLLEVEHRPLLSVFLPDRLELIKGAPGLRRSHLDQVIAAVWPTRRATRRAYAQALAQRNALIARIRSGRGDRSTLEAWDLELATHGIVLRNDRAAALEMVREYFATHAQALGLTGVVEIAYRPKTLATTVDQLAQELAERTESDIARGFSGHGPHRDDIVISRDGRSLRSYGSQGEQRLALLSLLLAERDALGAVRARPPMMLLDDVMSELDANRRELLAEDLARGGQTLITTTDLDHVPHADAATVLRASVEGATVTQELNFA